MAVKRSERLKPIHGLAQQREEVAAQALGRMQRELNNQTQKLTELMGYYQEYQVRFAEDAKHGMNVTQVQSYQTFISQLEVAIEEQKKIITRVTEACTSSKKEWHNERQKSQVLEKVVTRYQQHENKQENKQEQRLLDEFVNNRHWHRNK